MTVCPIRLHCHLRYISVIVKSYYISVSEYR